MGWVSSFRQGEKKNLRKRELGEKGVTKEWYAVDTLKICPPRLRGRRRLCVCADETSEKGR